MIRIDLKRFFFFLKKSKIVIFQNFTVRHAVVAPYVVVQFVLIYACPPTPAAKALWVRNVLYRSSVLKTGKMSTAICLLISRFVGCLKQNRKLKPYWPPSPCSETKTHNLSFSLIFCLKTWPRSSRSCLSRQPLHTRLQSASELEYLQHLIQRLCWGVSSHLHPPPGDTSGF